MSKPHELDHDRERRLGFPEVVFGASKTLDALQGILAEYQQIGKNALVTKLQAQKAESLLRSYPDAFYDAASGIFLLAPNSLASPTETKVAIISAGTSDLFVANEAFHTLRFLGIGAERINDIGIAGIHRLLDKLEALRAFDVLIVIAGFEGALPTAIGGLCSQPLIAVPASVGYGVAAGGQVALNAMLSSCANGITVVNIDNGYGAAIAAARILKQFATRP